MGCVCYCNPFRRMWNSAPARQMKGKASKKDKTKPQGGSGRWDTRRGNNPEQAPHPPITATVIWGLPKPSPQHETLIYPTSNAPVVAVTKDASLPELEAQNEIPSSLSYEDRSGSSDFLCVSPDPRYFSSHKRDYQCTPTPTRGVAYHAPDDNESLTTLFSDENPHACTVS